MSSCERHLDQGVRGADVPTALGAEVQSPASTRGGILGEAPHGRVEREVNVFGAHLRGAAGLDL